MSEPRAQRTLVKSPPELWAEISDVSTLARHLGEFGDIRITRLEAETTVVWEGDRARGTVELEPSGWGTKVTITAEAVAADPYITDAEVVADEAVVEDREAEAPPPVVAEAPVEEERDAEEEPAAEAPTAAEAPPAVAEEPIVVAEEPAATEPPTAEAAPTASQRRRGLL
ncbi:MAG: hypothetical protein JWR63_1610, partial [Conexibacter sp.]|nr:hypothetical protein [Conexibacter sp.]